VNPADLDLHDAIVMLRDRRLASAELLAACRARIQSLDSHLHAFDRVFSEHPSWDSSGEWGGVPYATKANIAVAGEELPCGSRALRGYRSPYDATVTRRLREQGAVALGSTNMDEFGMGSSTEHSDLGPTRNPCAMDRVPGGSSGGSAAAVAARMVPFALGTDTGGSIRQPAGFCGVVGLRPTYGRVSRHGLVAFASSFDQIGPLTRTVRDAALVLGTLAGSDPRDMTTSAREQFDPAGAESGSHSPRIGVPGPLLAKVGLDPEVRANYEDIVERLRREGAQIVRIDLPDPEATIAAYYVLAAAEASSNLARYDGVRYGRRAAGTGYGDMVRRTRSESFGEEVKRRILMGTYVLSAGYRDRYYQRAQEVRRCLRRDYLRTLNDCDVLLLPTSPTLAFARGERREDPLQMYRSDILTVGSSLVGLPAMAVPSGMGSQGLPHSVQVIGRPFDEAEIFRVGQSIESVRDFDLERRVSELHARIRAEATASDERGR
jgi:aspartyl-tRNA(Asn)/glutamyl-tRNA(Gln) amidotransferase subunit A